MNWKPKPGDKNPNAKLNWEKVREIRRMARDGEKKKELSVTYGVALRTISSIVNGERWIEGGGVYVPKGFRWQ